MHILKFDSETAWVDNAVVLWGERLRRTPALRMCLTSGHTPNKIYHALAESITAQTCSMKQSEVFALDDFGGLALDDAGRCANMLRHHLLNRIEPPARFHTIDTESPRLPAVCAAYDAAIAPGFDLAVLGLGLNGHLGINEPGSSPDSTTRRVDLHPTTIRSSAGYLAHDELPTWGVTVGLKQLLAAREVWLLVSGASKADILAQAVRGPVTADVPASFLQRHPNCYLFADAAAASKLMP